MSAAAAGGAADTGLGLVHGLGKDLAEPDWFGSAGGTAVTECLLRRLIRHTGRACSSAGDSSRRTGPDGTTRSDPG
jgi:hypothetical protein